MYLDAIDFTTHLKVTVLSAASSASEYLKLISGIESGFFKSDFVLDNENNMSPILIEATFGRLNGGYGTTHTIPIAYGSKFYGSMRMVGQERWICDKLLPEELIPKIEDAWIHREEIRNELESKVATAKQGALLNGKLAEELLDSYQRK